MKKYVLKLVLIALILFVAGCSSKKEIEGEVFLDSGTSVEKLALVDIHLVSEDKFLASIKNALPGAEQEAIRLTEFIGKLAAQEETTVDLLQKNAAFNAFNSVMPPVAGMGAGAAMVAAQNASVTNKSMELLKQNRVLADGLKKDLAGIKSGANALFFQSPFEGATSTQTNSDGKYKITLESDKRVVLVAVKDALAWAFWVTPDKSTQTVILSNKNLSGTGCPKCVFGGKVTPKSLTGS